MVNPYAYETDRQIRFSSGDREKEGYLQET